MYFLKSRNDKVQLNWFFVIQAIPVMLAQDHSKDKVVKHFFVNLARNNATSIIRLCSKSVCFKVPSRLAYMLRHFHYGAKVCFCHDNLHPSATDCG